MFKREIVMSIPEYLEMVENEKIKKMKKEMSKKQFKKIIKSLFYGNNHKADFLFCKI